MSVNLTGIWHGSYRDSNVDCGFVAALLHSGSALHGTIHDDYAVWNLALNATVSGAVDGGLVAFTKTYDGSNGWSHTVRYQGEVVDDGSEIRGTWSIPPSWDALGGTGAFLMIRRRNVANANEPVTEAVE